MLLVSPYPGAGRRFMYSGTKYGRQAAGRKCADAETQHPMTGAEWAGLG